MTKRFRHAVLSVMKSKRQIYIRNECSENTKRKLQKRNSPLRTASDLFVLMLVRNSELKVRGFKEWIRENALNDASVNTRNHYKQKSMYKVLTRYAIS